MAKQAVGIGTSANDGTGDTLRAGADKINDNFDEIYSALGNGTTLTDIIDTNGVLDVSQGANKIVFYYAALSDLPSASTYHGAIAHVHALGGMYFAHGGAWLRLNDEASGPVTKYTAGVNGSTA
jgi:enamine deaminase RidA (YjgF/YER057c/UK114 family)